MRGVAAMAEAVTGLTGVSINRDHKPGGSGTVGMTAYMAAPADGYNVLEHIDDASSAHALASSSGGEGGGSSAGSVSPYFLAIEDKVLCSITRALYIS